MAKFKVTVKTEKTGSEVSAVIDIPDEDLEGCNDEAREIYIDQIASDKVWEMVEYTVEAA